MENLNLGSDEKIIRQFERIIIAGVRHEAVLTDRRLILAEAGTGTVHREAEYSRIVLAVLSQNSLREPEVSLSFTAAGGEIETEDLIFVHLPGGLNMQAADKCMEILKEQQVPVRIEVKGSSMRPPTRAEAIAPVSPQEGVTPGRQAVPDFSSIGTGYPRQNVPPVEPRGILSSPLVIAGLVIAIIIVIALLLSIGGVPGGQKVPPVTPAPTPVVTAAPVTTIPVTTPAVTAVPTPEPQAVPTPMTIPQNGIWLYISSPGNYVGGIKAQGWTSAINATGEYLIQIAAQNTLIEGSVEKTDGSGNPVDVKLYNGGVPVFSGSTSKPYGMIQIRQQVGPAVIRNPSATPPPTPAISTVPTPDTSLALKQVPPSGIFVRVSYNGPFTGSISANGQERVVSGSGDQFFQVALGAGAGQVDGSIEKPDGTDRNLVVGIYKDGVLVTAMNTMRPFGVVEFHTSV